MTQKLLLNVSHSRRDKVYFRDIKDTTEVGTVKNIVIVKVKRECLLGFNSSFSSHDKTHLRLTFNPDQSSAIETIGRRTFLDLESTGVKKRDVGHPKCLLHNKLNKSTPTQSLHRNLLLNVLECGN